MCSIETCGKFIATFWPQAAAIIVHDHHIIIIMIVYLGHVQGGSCGGKAVSTVVCKKKPIIAIICHGITLPIKAQLPCNC